MSLFRRILRIVMIVILAVFVIIAIGLYFYTQPDQYVYNDYKGALDLAIEEKYDIQTLELEDDYEGEVVATLLKHPPLDSTKKAVLYIHGYSDYFFHDHMAQWYVDQGYNFYALDLRKHGRSWLPHQRPCIIKNVNEFFEEIDMALDIIEKDGHDFILMNGHSNGGLVTSIYLTESPNSDRVDAVFLNSPFFRWPFDDSFNTFIHYLSRVATIRPFGTAPNQYGTTYAETLHAEFGKEWDYNKGCKPHRGFPKYLAWFKAVEDAQQKVIKGLDIQQPILVLSSDETYKGTTYTPEAEQSDLILWVEHIEKYTPNLGKNVTYAQVPDAMHDLFLSSKEVRAVAFEKLGEWLKEVEE
ncbi:MAG: alpha/beta hydrolase [Bacteroidota bacterium]